MISKKQAFKLGNQLGKSFNISILLDLPCDKKIVKAHIDNLSNLVAEPGAED